MVWSDERVARSYERWYETVGRRADVLEKALLLEFLEAVPDARTLLDVGCGTGHFTRWFGTRGLWSSGLDLSPAMLAEAVGRDQRKYLRADASSLPFAEGTFDLVTVVTALESVSYVEGALVEAVRVARRAVIVGSLNRWSLPAAYRKLKGGAVWPRARFFSVRELKTLIGRAAGVRLRKLDVRTALMPLGLERAASLLPVGGFIGAGALLEERGSSKEAGS